MSDRSFLGILEPAFRRHCIHWRIQSRQPGLGCLPVPAFFRTHGRFPSREADLCSEGLRYLGRQLDLVVPDTKHFRFHHVNARHHRVAILRHPGVRRALGQDRLALRAWLVEDCRRSSRTIEDQVADGYAWCLARSIYIPSDKIMERLVRGARHDFLEGLLTSIARDLPAATRAKLETSRSEPKGRTGFHVNKRGLKRLMQTPTTCRMLPLTGI